jgi:hypothetical protein
MRTYVCVFVLLRKKWNNKKWKNGQKFTVSIENQDLQKQHFIYILKILPCALRNNLRKLSCVIWGVPVFKLCLGVSVYSYMILFNISIVNEQFNMNWRSA